MNKDFKITIAEKITELEAKHKIRVIYAALCGSRSWGYAHEDSDYDIRFIFVRRPDQYIRVHNIGVGENITEKYEGTDTFDFHGWDIRHALELIGKSKYSVIEALLSERVYGYTYIHAGLRALMQRHYHPKAYFHQHLVVAKRNLATAVDHGAVPEQIKCTLQGMHSLIQAIWAHRYVVAPDVGGLTLENQGCICLGDHFDYHKLMELVKTRQRGEEGPFRELALSGLMYAEKLESWEMRPPERKYHWGPLDQFMRRTIKRAWNVGRVRAHMNERRYANAPFYDGFSFTRFYSGCNPFQDLIDELETVEALVDDSN